MLESESSSELSVVDERDQLLWRRRRSWRRRRATRRRHYCIPTPGGTSPSRAIQSRRRQGSQRAERRSDPYAAVGERRVTWSSGGRGRRRRTGRARPTRSGSSRCGSRGRRSAPRARARCSTLHGDRSRS